MYDSRQYLIRMLRLVPGGLLFIGLIWGAGLVILLVGGLRTSIHGRGEAGSLSSVQHARPAEITDGDRRLLTSRFHVSGTGRALDWRPEHLRQFDFIEERVYTSRFTDVNERQVDERRTIRQLRFLLLSSPPDADTKLKWGITSILDHLGPADSLLKLGKDGMSVRPIHPESLSDNERSRVLQYVHGPENTEDPPRRNVIRYISPLEGTTFSLRHHLQKTGFETTLTDEREVSGLEQDVLLHAPVHPGTFLGDPRDHGPVNGKSGTAGGTNLIPGSVVENYLQPFLRCRLQGAALLQKNNEGNTYVGSGGFNMLSHDASRQIGELRVERIRIQMDPDTNRVRRASLRGRISVTDVPDQHFLRRITFLNKPVFRITYSSGPS